MKKQFLACVALMPALLGATVQGARAQVRVELDSLGLKSLQWHGHEFVMRAEDYQGFQIRGVTLQNVDGSAATFDAKSLKHLLDASSKRVTIEGPSLRASSTWTAAGDDLSIDAQIQNTSGQIIRGVDLQPLTLRFPAQPQGFNGDPRLDPNRDAPALIEAASADAKDDWDVLIENQTPARPLIWGFPYSIDRPAHRTYPLIASTQGLDWLGRRFDPYIDKPLLPGASEHIKLVLHFGTRAQIQKVRAQVLADWARQFPMVFQWDDRRPIGMAVLSTSDEGHHSKTNPRGWLLDPKLDVSNTAEFRKRMLDYARNTVRVCKAMNAQGVIVWDLEGQEFPHATSYIGDPRSLPPESEKIADEFFQVLKDGGLKVGLCVRPQRPVRGAYDNTVQQVETENPAQTLIDKITYARKRWNATMFYVDSNGDPNVPIPAQIFEQVHAAVPDVLLIPEQQDARYYRSTAPYDELRGGVTSTPAWARALYPRAFTVINVSDGDTKGKHAELVQAVKSGDVLMFRAWWDDPFNADVKSIYAEAKRQ